MAQAKKRSTRKLVFGDRNGLGRLQIDLEAFFEFSFWMAEELEDLISRHRTACATGRATETEQHFNVRNEKRPSV